jgi:hypothetical protein
MAVLPHPNQSIKSSKKNRLPLPNALLKGALALHKFEESEDKKGKRESSFKVKVGVNYGITIKGKKHPRVFFYIGYAKSNDGKNTIKGELAKAVKGRFPIHVGSVQNAFWLIFTMSQNLIKKTVKASSKIARSSIVWITYLVILIYVLLHPELNVKLGPFLKPFIPN